MKKKIWKKNGSPLKWRYWLETFLLIKAEAIIVFSPTLWSAPSSWPSLLTHRYPSLHLLLLPCCCGGSSIREVLALGMQWYRNSLPFSGHHRFGYQFAQAYPSHWWKGEGLFLWEQHLLKDVGRGLPALSNTPDRELFFRKKVLTPPNEARTAISTTQVIRN